MDPKRTPKITFFLDQYELKKINFPSEPKKKRSLETTTKQSLLMFCFDQEL